MIRLFHISDTHIGGNRHWDKRKSAVIRLLEGLQPIVMTPEKGVEKYLLITGDIIDNSSDSFLQEFALADKLLRPFAGRVLLVPGNHDYGHLGNSYSLESAKRFDVLARSLKMPPPSGMSVPFTFLSRFPYTLELVDGETKVLLILLNSCSDRAWRDFARGELSHGLLDALEALLLAPAFANHWKVVAMHHRLYDIRWAPLMGVKGAKEALQVLEGRIDVLAYGHQGEVAMLRKAHSNASPAEWRGLLATLEPHSSRPEGDAAPAVAKREGSRPLYALDANTSPAEGAYFEISFDHPLSKGPLRPPEVKGVAAS